MAKKTMCPKCSKGRLFRVYTLTDRTTNHYICLKCKNVFDKKVTFTEVK